MALFKLFKGKTEDEGNVLRACDHITEAVTDEEVDAKSNQTFQETNSDSNNHLTVSYATGWPIDIIYGYMHKNYEQKGYDDAMINSNLVFRDMNKAIIRNKILMVFREVNVNYESMRNDIETRIETCNAAGLLTTAAELDKKMSVILSHMEELKRLEDDLRNNANDASVPLMSYECGFLRGISIIAMSTPSKSMPIQSTSIDSNSSMSCLSA